jgi:hypothetical protein
VGVRSQRGTFSARACFSQTGVRDLGDASCAPTDMPHGIMRVGTCRRTFLRIALVPLSWRRCLSNIRAPSEAYLQKNGAVIGNYVASTPVSRLDMQGTRSVFDVFPGLGLVDCSTALWSVANRSGSRASDNLDQVFGANQLGKRDPYVVRSECEVLFSCFKWLF